MIALQPDGLHQLGDSRVTLLVIFLLMCIAPLPIYLRDRARTRRRNRKLEHRLGHLDPKDTDPHD